MTSGQATTDRDQARIDRRRHARTATGPDDRRPSDELTASLVARAQEGDSTAFADLYRFHARYVGRIVADSIGDPNARLDVTQTVFERAMLKLGTLRNPAAFRPWVAQIARRAIIDHHRQTSRVVATDFGTDDEAAELPADEWAADDWIAMRELAAAVDVAIAGLSERDVTVIELASTFGFDAREIAAALDITQGHARVLLHRARRRLGKALGENVLSKEP